MYIFLRIFSSALAFLMMFGPDNDLLHPSVGSDDIGDQRNVGSIISLPPQPCTYSAPLKKADLEYFQSVTGSTTYGEIIRDIGPADYITGSGIITYHWKLDDDSVANMTFFDDHIMTLVIVNGEGVSEWIIW